MRKQGSASSMASIDEDEDDEKGQHLSMNRLALLAPTTSNHAHAKSADFAAAQSEEEVEEEWVASPRRSLVGQSLKRRYLLDVKEFMAYLEEAVSNGLHDKSGECRQIAFSLLHKLEREKAMQRLNIDALALSKFKKWKERKANKKRRKKKSNKKRRPRHAQRDRNQSVTITIGSQ